MELQIVNPDPKYSKARLIEPTTLGYIHLAAEVSPLPMPPQRLPFVLDGHAKAELLAGLHDACGRIVAFPQEAQRIHDGLRPDDTSRIRHHIAAVSVSY